MFPLPAGNLDPNVAALARFIRETRTGSTSATWALTDRPMQGFELIFKNGVLLDASEYTITGKNIILSVAPLGTDRVTAFYYYPAN